MVKRPFSVKTYLAILAGVGFGGIITSYFMAANSEAYQSARDFLVTNPKVVEALGPIKSDRLGINYLVRERTGDGTARLKIVLTGERKAANAIISLEAADGAWRVKTATLIVDDKNAILLLPKVD